MEANCRHKEGANWPHLFINNNHTNLQHLCKTEFRKTLQRATGINKYKGTPPESSGYSSKNLELSTLLF